MRMRVRMVTYMHTIVQHSTLAKHTSLHLYCTLIFHIIQFPSVQYKEILVDIQDSRTSTLFSIASQPSIQLELNLKKKQTKMPNLLSVSSWFALIVSITASYSGPFVLWGRDELAQLNGNSLMEIDVKFLSEIYSDSSAIILFVRNASNQLNEENFPIFKDLLSKTSYAYLPQQHLGLDPMEFNLNAEVNLIQFSRFFVAFESHSNCSFVFKMCSLKVINLVGPTSQQDVELSALYRDSVITYGDGKVLGILATRTTDHDIQKRATPDENPENPEQPPNQANPSAANPPDEAETIQSDYVFYPTNPQSYKILLHTSGPPSIVDGTNITELYNNVSLTITTNSRSTDQRILKVRYNYKGGEKVCKS